MKTVTMQEFHLLCRAQGVPEKKNIAFICPMCGTVQSGATLISAGAGATMVDVEKYIGFSCVGRFTGQGAPGKADAGCGCNWTLGGLFQMHKMEVVMDDGKSCPIFELATPEQAQALAFDDPKQF